MIVSFVYIPYGALKAMPDWLMVACIIFGIGMIIIVSNIKR